MDKQKVLLVGGTRGLGKALSNLLSSDYAIRAVGSAEMDVSDDQTVQHFFNDYSPDVVVFLAVRNIDSTIHKLKVCDAVVQVETNSLGLLHVLRCALPQMREKKFGRIIYISSILASHTIKGVGVYSACKCFGESLMRTVALENAEHGVTANTLQLGYFNVGLIEKIPADFQQTIIAGIPVKRLGTVEDLAPAIRFVVGNSYLNGATLQIAGGLEAK
jgi:NAD(P)-dependent dehydrogenase (short-subunit alcohol dehydrogenase family)